MPDTLFAATQVANGVANPSYQPNAVRYVELSHDNSNSNSNQQIQFETVNSNNQTTNDDINSNNSTGLSSSYRAESTRNNEANKRIVTTCDLICYAFQVARGMEYLASR